MEMVRSVGSSYVYRYISLEAVCILVVWLTTIPLERMSANTVIRMGVIIAVDVLVFLLISIVRNFREGQETIKSNVFALGREFGLPAVIGVVARPSWLWICPILLDNYQAGTVVGKIMADITFYVLSALSHRRFSK